jgi:pyrroline-5-carboxylate reductase
MTPVLLLGAGRMGGALIQGWREAGAFSAADLIVRDPNVDAAAFAGALVNPPLEALSAAKTVLLAVKPQSSSRSPPASAPPISPKPSAAARSPG